VAEVSDILRFQFVQARAVAAANTHRSGGDRELRSSAIALQLELSRLCPFFISVKTN
jgi:hypothetical protein